MAPIIIGVAGGTGSGKTTVLSKVVNRIGADHVSWIHSDSYYRDQKSLTLEERAALNYDHPDAIEIDLMLAHLRALRDGREIEMPTYNFTEHVRTEETTTVHPSPVIIVEGILVLAQPELRNLLDIRVFVDTDPDLRLIRRILRDMSDRGRSLHAILDQYLSTVRLMHLEFVEPSKRYAHIILPEGEENDVGVEMLIGMVESVMSKQETAGSQP